MKQKAIEIVLNKFERINKYLRKSGKRFHGGHIHLFRLEVKKLLSFFEMLSLKQSKTHFLKRLQKLYKILGKIRLIQLQKKAILITISKNHINLPTNYLKYLENDKHRLQKKAKYRIKNMKPLKTKRISKELPNKIGPVIPREYFSLQINALNNLLALEKPDEQSLHQIRKVLKNMLDDLPFMSGSKIQDFKYCTKDEMKCLESKIGEIHDISLSLKLLVEAPKCQYGIEEKQILTSIQNRWQKDKDDLRRQINLSVLMGTKEGILKGE